MTKQTQIRTIAMLLALVLGTAGMVYAQNETVQYGKENLERDYCTGYNIKVYCNAPDNTVIYLYEQDIVRMQVVDSAFLKKGKAVFSKNVLSKERNDVTKLIPKGVYIMYSDGWDFAFTFLIDQETNFEIKIQKTTEAEANGVKYPYHWQKREFVNSEENQLWMNILLVQEKAEFPFDAIGAAAELASIMPQSFVGKHFLLEQQVYMAGESDDETILFGLGNVDSSKFHHVMSQVDFTDGRLFHSQSLFSMFVSEYLISENRESAAEIITEVDTILTRAARGGRYQCGLYAQWLYGIFDKAGDPYYEPVMLHIYDTYDRGWIPEDQERRIKRQMDRIRKLAPGAQIPELTAFDINGKQHSTNDIQTKYTILWFWDPDCDHCQEETPVLHDLYQKEADNLDFEVFAVEVNDDYDRWKAFSEKHGLSDWINLSTSMGETSVDYIEYFDIVTTPVILLIDNQKNHAIIARQTTLDEIMRLMK
jgi:thiol-disulfide isomerase/thioredoxin